MSVEPKNYVSTAKMSQGMTPFDKQVFKDIDQSFDDTRENKDQSDLQNTEVNQIIDT